MAKKEDLVQDILMVSNEYTEEDLMKLTNRQLVSKLNELKNADSEEIEEVKVEQQEEIKIDREALEKEIREKIMQEMREKMEKEIREQMTSNTVQDKKKVTEIDRYREVPVMNLTNGQLVYVSKKTGAEWVWETYGDIAYIEFQELQAIRTSSKAFIYDPLFMILDDEIVNYLGLEKLYDKLLEVDDLDEIFRMNNKDFEKFIENAPKTIVVSVVTRAREKYEDNTLDSMYKVKYLNEKFNAEIGKRG